ncbi:galacturonosyltransferase [Pseudobutyrivibrio sp. C4]|uniref:glycosyltransferase family 4 protein n=1 Tax=Pseudobutyrivibrio sp. C4 TaxID=1520803 RepID=UPI0008BB6726|nr:glycosyltransferase family 4 protein [Pseudobutyrivibrio sp. C4]SET24867.1 galacturonosyltransferase [Pseudobutyrivibrio sp. C4]
MNILIIANNDVGLYQFRRDLIKELLKNNEVHIALPYGEKVEDLVQIGCKFIDTPLERRGMNPLKDIALFKLYKKVLKEVSPDLVITYTIKPNIYGGLACKQAGVPYVVNITGLGTAFQKDGLLKSFVVSLYKKALKKAKVVLFENEGNRQVFLENHIITEDRTHVLHGAGVNTDLYSLVPYPNHTDEVKFLFVGRVMKEKGVEELFQAMQMLLKDGIACHLDVVGWCEEDYTDTLNQYQAEGWLTNHGFQNDVKPFIEACDCFVLPSWHEGMANTNLESASSGRPVITTNIHGCMESVENGVTGFLIEKQNAVSLYEGMKKFLALSLDERKAMGLAGRERMVEIFDKKKVVEDTIKAMDI